MSGPNPPPPPPHTHIAPPPPRAHSHVTHALGALAASSWAVALIRIARARATALYRDARGRLEGERAHFPRCIAARAITSPRAPQASRSGRPPCTPLPMEAE